MLFVLFLFLDIYYTVKEEEEVVVSKNRGIEKAKQKSISSNIVCFCVAAVAVL